jgi:hypothetical protein
LEKTERDTEESVAALGGRCEDFLGTNATVSNLLDWFWTEAQTLPTVFTECNENITCFTLVGVFKMLVGVECEHLPELKNWFYPAMLQSCTTCQTTLAG